MADIELVIKIDEDTYKACQRAVNNPKMMVDEVDVAIANGIPLDKIRDEIMDTGAYEQEVNGKTEFLKGIDYCLGIIDKYMSESEV